MKVLKKLLGSFLAIALVFSMVLVVPIRVKAADEKYYTVKIVLGNISDASFNTDKIDALGLDSKNDIKGNKLVITEKIDSAQPKSFTINQIKDAIDIKKDANGASKYYVKGIRVSGADDLFTEDVVLDKDETYVVAYGVGEILSYNVKFIDDKGAEIYKPLKLYAAKGENITVSPEHVAGYKPDADAKGFILLNDGQEIVFTYTPYNVKEIITETEITRIEHIDGPTIYTHDYQYIEGEPVVNTITNNNNGVVSNRRITNPPRVVAEANTGNAEGDNAEGDNAAAGEGTTTIGDDQTPLAGDKKEEVEIPNSETPLGPVGPEVPEEEGLSLLMIVLIVIIILSILTLIITWIYMMTKRQKERVKDNK